MPFPSPLHHEQVPGPEHKCIKYKLCCCTSEAPPVGPGSRAMTLVGHSPAVHVSS